MISAFSMFCEAFDSKTISESVMDYPQGDGLCGDVWEKDGDGWKMKKSVSSKLLDVSKKLTSSLDLGGVTTMVVGSICTNSYDEDSDIDLHLEAKGLDGKDEDFMKELNKKARKALEDEFGKVEFGGHPVEVYVQNNRFQDMGSRGAYDVSKEKWIAGPQIRDKDFDPYKEYFEKALDSMEDLGSVKDAGKAVFDALILSKTMLLMRDGDMVKFAYSRLEKVSENAKEAFDKIRSDRKMSSTPDSRKESKRMRDDEEWNVKDAAFKILGDVGILAVLKDLSKLKDSDGDEKDKAKSVIDSVGKNLFKD